MTTRFPRSDESATRFAERGRGRIHVIERELGRGSRSGPGDVDERALAREGVVRQCGSVGWRLGIRVGQCEGGQRFPRLELVGIIESDSMGVAAPSAMQ